VDMEDNREVTEAEGQALAEEWNIPYIETSAKMNENVEASFMQMIQLVHLRKKEASKKAQEALATAKKYKRKHKFKKLKCVIS